MFFRDYGLYDHAMLRFSKGHKISENFYMRQDGTRAYYFSESMSPIHSQLNGNNNSFVGPFLLSMIV